MPPCVPTRGSGDSRIGGINSNTFQDLDYKLGSVCNPDPAIRRKASRPLVTCCDIARPPGANA